MPHILITGASNTGKSTVVKAFASKNPEYHVIPEQVRKIVSSLEGMNINQLQPLLFDNQRKAEREAASKTHVIADRSLVDIIAYALYYKADPSIVRGFMNFLSFYGYYTHIFVIPPSDHIPFVDDGFRLPEKQDDIHDLIVRILSYIDVPYHIITQSTTPSRVKFIEDIVTNSLGEHIWSLPSYTEQ